MDTGADDSALGFLVLPMVPSMVAWALVGGTHFGATLADITVSGHAQNSH